MPQDRVTLRFLMTAAGPINSGDLQLANASQGQIISFNLDPSDAIVAQAKRLGMTLKLLPLCALEQDLPGIPLYSSAALYIMHKYLIEFMSSHYQMISVE